jgi:hypothetical protein
MQALMMMIRTNLMMVALVFAEGAIQLCFEFFTLA